MKKIWNIGLKFWHKDSSFGGGIKSTKLTSVISTGTLSSLIISTGFELECNGRQNTDKHFA